MIKKNFIFIELLPAIPRIAGNNNNPLQGGGVKFIPHPLRGWKIILIRPGIHWSPGRIGIRFKNNFDISSKLRTDGIEPPMV
jgi:hypothetical protein